MRNRKKGKEEDSQQSTLNERVWGDPNKMHADCLWKRMLQGLKKKKKSPRDEKEWPRSEKHVVAGSPGLEVAMPA